jgi:ElaB/YqjD/DUF883 family membrane-anchored ribosome-binding protein
MIEELLAVKKRREHYMRARIEEIVRSEQALARDIESAREEIRLVLQRWRSLLNEGGTRSHEEFASLRNRLADVSSRERSLEERIDQLSSEKTILAESLKQQTKMLMGILKSQEKLRFLRDEWM